MSPRPHRSRRGAVTNRIGVAAAPCPKSTGTGVDGVRTNTHDVDVDGKSDLSLRDTEGNTAICS